MYMYILIYIYVHIYIYIYNGLRVYLTAIAAWRAEVRQTHPYRHFGYSKHLQGNGAVDEMDDNRDRRGDHWVGIGYAASSRCSTA